MKTLRRIPNVTILDTATMDVQVERTPEGFLRAAINATRSGIFIYMDDLGMPIRALRPEAEVFDPASMVTLAAKPITRKHPSQLLNAKTAAVATVGSTGDQAMRVDDFLRITGTIFDGDTVADIVAGRQEVSCGYTADIIDEPGVDPTYGPYDVRQENIRYNHLAVAIEAGRGGPEVRMLLDSSDFTSAKERTMDKTIKLGDLEFPCSDKLCDALTAHLGGMKAAHDAAMTKACDELAAKWAPAEAETCDMSALVEAVATEAGAAKLDSVEVKTEKGIALKASLTKLQGQVAGLATEVKTKMDALDAAAVVAPERVAELAKSQALLVATVCALDSAAKPVELFAKPAAELRKLAILARDPQAVLDGKSEDFVMGRFEAVASTVKPANVGEVLGSMLLDSAITAITKDEGTLPTARPAWKATPLSASNRADKK